MLIYRLIYRSIYRLSYCLIYRSIYHMIYGPVYGSVCCLDVQGLIGMKQSDSVLYAFTKVDRALFAPNRPYEDSPQRIGHDATISAPHMHAHAAELLEKFFKPNSKVLDIGCGSGYLLAIFARMIEFKAKHPAEGPKDETSSWNKNNPAYTAETGTSLSSGQDAKVYGIEHIDELTQLSRENLSSDPYLKKKLDDKDIELRTGDGHKGWPEKGL